MQQVRFESAEPAGSVSLCEGTVVATDLPIRFVADWRMAENLLTAFAAGEKPICNVEDYQLLGAYRKAMSSVCPKCGGKAGGPCEPDEGEE